MPAGYKIRGIAPFELRNYPDPVKLQFWGWVVDLGIKAKDRDLAEGLDAFGEPLRPISRKTRKHRKSEMTPTGEGDPSAPPLMPGRGLSRTRSLLAGRAFVTHAEFYWRFDPFTADTWAKILTIHKRKGRDVFGLSEEATDRVKRQALAMWMKWKKAGAVAPLGLEGRRVLGPEYHQAPAVVETMGRTSLEYATHGIGTPDLSKLTPGRHQGGLTESELRTYLRGTAAANVQGRPGAAYNRILSHIWGPAGGPTSGGGAVAPLLPPPRPKAPLKPIPAALAKVKEAQAEQRKANVEAAAIRPVVFKPPAEDMVAAYMRQRVEELRADLPRIERELLENAPAWGRLNREINDAKAKMWDYSLSKPTRKKWEKKFDELKKSAEYQRLEAAVKYAPYQIEHAKREIANYVKKLADLKAAEEDVRIDYAGSLARHPDLIEPGYITERLAKYRLGDAKVEALKVIDIEYRGRAQDLDDKETALNQAIDKLQLSFSEMDMTELTGKLDAANKKLDAVKAAQKVLAEKRRDDALKVLEIDPKRRITFSHAASDADATSKQVQMYPMDEKTREKAEKGTEWLSRTFARGDGQFADSMKMKIGMIPGARAHQGSVKPDAKYNILVAQDESADVVVHEFGHAIDEGLLNDKEKVLARSLEFLDHRLKGEKPIELKTLFSWYDEGEKGAKDEFDKVFTGSSAYYVGKDYGRGATEIISMGIQQMFNNPTHFARRDPEYFKFIAGIMDGSLR